MQWSARVLNGRNVLKISGPVVSADVSRLKLLLSPKCIATSPVVDISEVTFLGPAGLDVLASATLPLANPPWPLPIVIGDRHTQVLHAIADAQPQTLRVFDTVESALAANPTDGE